MGGSVLGLVVVLVFGASAFGSALALVLGGGGFWASSGVTSRPVATRESISQRDIFCFLLLFELGSIRLLNIAGESISGLNGDRQPAKFCQSSSPARRRGKLEILFAEFPKNYCGSRPKFDKQEESPARTLATSTKLKPQAKEGPICKIHLASKPGAVGKRPPTRRKVTSSFLSPKHQQPAAPPGNRGLF